jgi:hypothetical protein
MTSARKTFYIIVALGFIVGVCIIVYMLITKNTSSNGKQNNFANIPYGYLNFDIYSVPGTKMDPYILYGPGYLPYESNVPAVDILRANGSKKTMPAYYKQYINHNNSPLAARNS